uniref:phosphoethanolamine N-methyltransferase n=1 Tax=Syphacia muris TaxID=451379 RepID=A0A0N5AGB7_9BILA
MAETMIVRENFKQFWDKYSHNTDNTAMMLNQNAAELEELDRFDILSCLPDLHGKNVVDIGAGIGRFTAVLAQTAQHVLSTDFIESFINKNRELNAAYDNITYKVADAVNLKLDDNSMDLVFTNWLMMYLTDEEVIRFLTNALHWLRPNGYLHLRESCSEPSTARTTGTLHQANAQNPSSYRFSSLYIKLYRGIRVRDQDGTVYRYDVLWSTSVPTYIMRQNNWRQVHWLLRKVKANDKLEPEFAVLLNKFGTLWRAEQKHWDTTLDDEGACWTDKVFESVLDKVLAPKDSTVFAYNPRSLAYHFHINVHFLSSKFFCNVWNVETNEFYYRTSLTKANKLLDRRIRFGWNEDLNAALNYWVEKNAAFDLFIATELLSTVPEDTLKKIKSIVKHNGYIVSIEQFDEDKYDESSIKKAFSFASDVSIKDVTAVCEQEIESYLQRRNQVGSTEHKSKQWRLITAQL